MIVNLSQHLNNPSKFQNHLKQVQTYHKTNMMFQLLRMVAVKSGVFSPILSMSRELSPVHKGDENLLQPANEQPPPHTNVQLPLTTTTQ